MSTSSRRSPVPAAAHRPAHAVEIRSPTKRFAGRRIAGPNRSGPIASDARPGSTRNAACHRPSAGRELPVPVARAEPLCGHPPQIPSRGPWLPPPVGGSDHAEQGPGGEELNHAVVGEEPATHRCPSSHGGCSPSAAQPIQEIFPARAGDRFAEFAAGRGVGASVRDWASSNPCPSKAFFRVRLSRPIPSRSASRCSSISTG